MMIDAAAVLFVAIGLLFFTAGTLGLLRFPDVHSRLHALTKADNLGLGFIVLGAAFHVRDVWMVGKLLLLWALGLAAAGAVAQLIARSALARLGTDDDDAPL